MRVALRVVVTGGVVGLVSVGVVSRLFMFLLIAMNREADGITTDDGFEMGQFTVSGSLNLALVGLVFGVISGLLYLLAETVMIGPDWFRTLSVGLGAGTVAAAGLVHSDGVDFHVLDPYWFAVALFVVLPIGHVVALDLLVRRLRRSRNAPPPSAPALLAWPVRGGLAIWFVLAAASLAGDISSLSEFNA